MKAENTPIANEKLLPQGEFSTGLYEIHPNDSSF
jgi:hypothetical protein